jgi:hypothetical protein
MITIEMNISDLKSNAARFRAEEASFITNALKLLKLGIIRNLNNFHEIFTTLTLGQAERLSNNLRIKYATLSLIFAVPLIAYLIRSIKSKQLFDFYIFFPVIYMAGLAASGAGHDRYYMLILPLIYLWIVYELRHWKYFQKSLQFLPFLHKNSKLYLIIGIIILIIGSWIVQSYLLENYLKTRMIILGIAGLVAICLIPTFLKITQAKQIGTFLIVLLLSLHVARSAMDHFFLQNFNKQLNMGRVQAKNDLISYINSKNWKYPVYEQVYNGPWIPVRSKIRTRWIEYKYDDTNVYPYICFIEEINYDPLITKSKQPDNFINNFKKNKIIFQNEFFRVHKLSNK